jgi:hypothetical protein
VAAILSQNCTLLLRCRKPSAQSRVIALKLLRTSPSVKEAQHVRGLPSSVMQLPP